MNRDYLSRAPLENLAKDEKQIIDLAKEIDADNSKFEAMVRTLLLATSDCEMVVEELAEQPDAAYIIFRFAAYGFMRAMTEAARQEAAKGN